MPSSPRIKLTVDDGIAHVTLNRPDKRNAIDWEMLEALVDLPGEISANRDVRVVILSGAGESFSSGFEFENIFASMPKVAKLGLKTPLNTTNFAQRACWAWREMPVPVIAVIRGHAFGAGLQLALAADFRFATPESQLSVMEGKFGLIPDMTGSVSLRELIPADLMKRLLMTAEVFDGEQAQRWGLVSAVSADPAADAAELAHKLIARSPDALAATKKLVQDTWTASPRSAFWSEFVLQARLLAGKNHRIARAAARRKGVPDWSPRSF